MLKAISFCGLLLVMATGLSHADVYQCRDANGTLIFTDDPLNIPPECQEKVISDLPHINVVPSTPSAPVRQRKAILPPASTNGEESQEKLERDYDSLKEEAEALVEKFVSTRNALSRAEKKQLKYKARDELIEIRSQKDRFLNDVDQSTLKREQKKEVREILESITEYATN